MKIPEIPNFSIIPETDKLALLAEFNLWLAPGVAWSLFRNNAHIANTFIDSTRRLDPHLQIGNIHWMYLLPQERLQYSQLSSTQLGYQAFSNWKETHLINNPRISEKTSNAIGHELTISSIDIPIFTSTVSQHRRNFELTGRLPQESSFDFLNFIYTLKYNCFGSFLTDHLPPQTGL